MKRQCTVPKINNIAITFQKPQILRSKNSPSHANRDKGRHKKYSFFSEFLQKGGGGASILNALKVIHSGTMQDLLNKIARVDKKGVIRIKKVSEEEFKRMNSWKRKSWSTRSRRWLKMMPHEILEGNPWEKGTKTRVKEWLKDNVRRRGLDSILWGRWEQCEEEEDGEEE